MLHFTRLLMAGLLVISASTLYSQTINTGSFRKVIVSPFIEATFIPDDQERVVINNSSVDKDKLHVETKNGTLRLYLEGAKEVPGKARDENYNGDQRYPNHAVTATVYYKNLESLLLRGEEHFSFPGILSAERFDLKLYGESVITFAKVQIKDLHATIYGESSLEIESGSVQKQSYTSYGEGKVNTTAISGTEAKLTAYGEAEFSMNVSDRIKITSFGEAKLRYKGDPQIVKGLNVGGIDVTKLD